ncbi:MAG: hypothetical protein KDM81_00725, partial [Verrucomicrobiae bacterium]|nr:hypothetical protein [Verrucomicrobiae bacterium]
MLVETGRYLRLIPFDDLQKMPLKLYQGLEETEGLSDGEVVTVVLELKNLEAKEVAESLTSMLSKAGSVAPLSRGRGLIVTDRIESLRRVRQLLAQIDAGAPQQRQMKIWPLKNASGTLLADLLNRTFGVDTAPKRTVFNEQRKTWDVLPANPEDYITAIFAEASNTLVLFGPAERMSMAEELITRFETESGARASEVKVFYPQMNAEDLGDMVREAIPGIASPRDNSKDAGVKARVIADSTSNRLIVTAPASGQLDSIEKLIHQLDPTTQEVPQEQAGEKRELRIVQLQTVSSSALAPILRDAFAEQLRNEKGADFTSRARILPDPSGGRLLLSGSPEELDQIATLIQQLDAGEEGQSEIKVFKLKVANARNVSAMIMGAMGGDTSRYQYRRSGGLQRPGGIPARAIADDRSNSLIVMASPEQMKLIEEVIQKIEEGGDTEGREVKLVKLEHNSATSVAAMLSQLYYAQIRGYDREKRIAVTAAPDDRTIALEADGESMKQLLEVVKELDVEPADSGFEVRTYAVPEGRVNDIISTLTRLYSAQRDSRGRDRGPEARFEADAASDTLIVAAKADQFPEIEALLEKLRTAVSSATQMRTFLLKHARADQVVNVLQSMLGDGGGGSRDWYYYQRNRGGGSGGNEFKVTSAPALNAIVMQAAPQKLALATQLIQTLDVPETSAAATVQTVALKRANADEVAAALSRMLSPRDYREAGSGVRVAAVSGSKTLLVSGPEAEVKRVVGLINELDSTAGESGQVTRVYRLQHADTDEVIQVLQSALDAVSSGGRSYYYGYRYGGGQGDTIKVSPADSLKAIVVQASTEKQQQVADLIALLDVEDAEGASVLRTVQLKQANADELAQAVTQILSPYDWRGDPPAVRVTPVSASKTLLVKGPQAEVERVVTLIEQLDATSGTAGQITKVYHLQHADAQEVVSVLETTLGGTGGSGRSYYYSYRYRGGGGTGGDVRVTAAEGLNSVVVQATPEKQKEAEALIKLLDVEEGGGQMVVRSVPLKQANADELANAVTQILSPLGSRGKAPPVKVTPVSSARTMLVKGPEEEVQRVVAMIEQLDATSGAAGQVTQVYQLKYADAREVVTVLESTLGAAGGSGRSYYYSYRYRGGGGGTSEEVRVTAAAGLNSVVVQATPEKQKQAEQLIALLDVEQAGQAGAIQTVRLERAAADGVAQAVNQALQPADRNGSPPSVRVTAVAVAKSVLVTGPPAEVTKVVELIKGLDVTSGETGVETRVYRLEHAEARQVADVLENTMGGGANSLPYYIYSPYRRGGGGTTEAEFKVTAASALNAVVIQASPTQHEQAASLIKALDVEQSAEAGLVRAIQLEKADANSVAMAVNETLSPRDWRSGSPTVWATAVSGTKTVLVNGPPAEVEKVVQLVRELDQAGGDAGMETKVYVLKHASAAQVVEVLQTTLGQTTSSPRSYSYYSYGYRRSELSEFKVTAASGVNAVIVQATPFKQTAAADLIAELDTPELAGAAQVRTVVLRKAEPEAVAQAVNESLAPEGRNGQAPAVRATPVLGTRSVLVRGPAAEVERVLALIAQLDDTGSGGGTETRVYQLKNGDATDLSRTLQQLLSGMARAQSRWASRYSSSNFTVAADERTNAIIVSGTPDAFSVVEQLLPMLDHLPERQDRQIQFYWLSVADAFDVADRLDTVFSDRPEKEQPIIEPDIFSNSLTVVANAADLVVIEDVIRRLDVGAPETTLQVRLITLGSVPADKMTAMLTNIYPQMSPTKIRVMDRLPTPVITPSTNRTGAPVTGSTNQQSSLSPPPAGGNVPSSTNRPAGVAVAGDTNTLAMRGLPGVPPVTASPATPSSILLSGAADSTGSTNALGAVAAVLAQRPDVFLSYDTEANAIIMSGPPLELDQIQDIIDSLSGAFGDTDTEIRQFPLKEADPVAVAKVLTELFKVPQPPQAQGDRQPPQTENGRPVPDRGEGEERERNREGQGGNRNNPPGGNRGGGQPPQQPRVAVVAEPRTRSVIVRASGADMPLMESVIK